MHSRDIEKLNKTLSIKGSLLESGNTYGMTYVFENRDFRYKGKFLGWDKLSGILVFHTAHSGYVEVPFGSVSEIETVNTYIADAISDHNDKAAAHETDPSGISASTPGAKLDAGKTFVEDILGGFPRALMGVAELGTIGATKYSLNGWMSVDDGVRRYRNAAGRHRLARQMGNLIDDGPKGTGLPHSYAEAWNILAALELELRSEEV